MLCKPMQTSVLTELHARLPGLTLRGEGVRVRLAPQMTDRDDTIMGMYCHRVHSTPVMYCLAHNNRPMLLIACRLFDDILGI